MPRCKCAPSDGDIAQLARAMALQAIGRGFESHYLHTMPGRGNGLERISLTFIGKGKAKERNKVRE